MLLRHPCAVANSKLKLGWDSHLDDFLMQDELVTDFLSPFQKELENAKDPFDKHIFMWCVENYIPLKQFNKHEILVVFYEHLCTGPEQQVERVMPFIGNTFSSDMLDKILKPSAQSRKDSAIVSGVDLVSSWRASVSDERVKRAIDILKIFGLQDVYNEGDMPLLDGTKALEVFSA